MFKKIVAQFFMPVPLISFILLAGLFRLLFTKKQLSGKFLVFTGFVLLVLFSNTYMSNYLTGYFESKHSAGHLQFSDEFYDREDESFVKYVVVLSGGQTGNPEIPVTSRMSESTMMRLIEGIRLYRKQLGSKLILSGGTVLNEVPSALLMARVAKELGVNDHDIIVESESRDTKDEARLIQPIVKDEPFILVTSAVHMHRAMAMFTKLGMNPVPAPAGHQVHSQGRGLIPFFPSSENLIKSKRAVHEYLGMIWASLNGQI
jgi:uncharacterized SAM-binding protein YcdF (DUF218 family)